MAPPPVPPTRKRSWHDITSKLDAIAALPPELLLLSENQLRQLMAQRAALATQVAHAKERAAAAAEAAATAETHRNARQREMAAEVALLNTTAVIAEHRRKTSTHDLHALHAEHLKSCDAENALALIAD